MAANEDSLRKVVQFDYLLHIVGMIFSFGTLTLVAVVLNYVKRGDSAGTVYESHMNYMIRYWWRWVLWMVVLGIGYFLIGLITLTIGFYLFAWVFVVPSIIFVYRMVMGLLSANDGKPAPA
jgi:uncharacterized membrane protein